MCTFSVEVSSRFIDVQTEKLSQHNSSYACQPKKLGHKIHCQ